MNGETKVCNTCEIEKEITKFRKTRKSYGATCKDCTNKKEKERYRLKKEQYDSTKEPKTKVCSKCNIEKDINKFWRKGDKRRSNCEDCAKKDLKERYHADKEGNREKLRQSYQKHKAQRTIDNKKNYQKNKEKLIVKEGNRRKKIKESIEKDGIKLPDIKEKYCNMCKKIKLIKFFYIRKTKNCYSANCISCITDNSQKYRDDNVKKIKKARKNGKKYKRDPLLDSLRKKLSVCIKRIKDYKNTTKILLDCSSRIFKKWIKFNLELDKLNKDDYGKTWEADHVIPCNLFDLKYQVNIERCFHWTNIRPLTRLLNSKKQNYIIPEHNKTHEKRLYDFIKKYDLNENVLSNWKDITLNTAPKGEILGQQHA